MAGAIPEETIEEIRSRTDLGELVASYGIALHHSGSSLKACCPFHREKTPSFSINPSRGFYHCFGCGEHGSAFDFVMKMEGLTFPEAVKRLASRCGVEIKEGERDPNAGRRKRLYALMAELAQFYRRCLLKTGAAQIAREYLAKRELGEKIQEDFLIGYAPAGASVMFKWAAKNGFKPEELEEAGVVKLPSRPGDDGYHRFSGRLMFPIRDRQGRVVAFSGRQLVEDKRSGKYVNSPETEIFRKSNVLYAFDRAAGNIARAPHREVIVCEGQIDCIRLHASGFPVAVASQGTAFTEEHVKMLSRVADSAALVFDDDNAGHKAAIRSAGMLLAAGMPVRVVNLPEGHDPDSFLRTKGPEAFQRLLDAAESVVSFQCRVEKAKEARDDTLDAVSRITKAVLSTIAQCPNAILRASMVGEASKLLSLPASALNEELQKVKAKAPPSRSLAASPPPKEPDENEGPPPDFEADEPPPDVEVPPEAAIPPPPREIALAAFLVAHEFDAQLDEMIARFLPDAVFAHDFTRRFVEAWRGEIPSGEDRLGPFADALPSAERAYFDAAFVDAGKSQASRLSPAEMMQDFVRALWVAYAERVRGLLPAADSSDATVARRLGLSMSIRRLRTAPWRDVPDLIATLSSGIDEPGRR